MDKSSCPRNPDLCLENRVMWVKQCHLHHPQSIIVFVGGMFTIPKCVVHDIVLPTENSVFHSIPLVFPWRERWLSPLKKMVFKMAKNNHGTVLQLSFRNFSKFLQSSCVVMKNLRCLAGRILGDWENLWKILRNPTWANFCLDWNPKKNTSPTWGPMKWILNGYTFQKQATSTWGPTKWTWGPTKWASCQVIPDDSSLAWVILNCHSSVGLGSCYFHGIHFPTGHMCGFYVVCVPCAWMKCIIIHVKCMQLNECNVCHVCKAT